MIRIDPGLWGKSRAGARAGRGFRYQDAVAAWMAADAWAGHLPWRTVVPEGVDDVTLHGPDFEARVQLKSRHDPRATFALAEVAGFFAKTVRTLPDDWQLRTDLHLAVVLERPVDGVDPSGWGSSLAAGLQVQAVAEALMAALGPSDLQTAQTLLGRCHLVVEAEPLERAIEALGAADLAPACSRALTQALRQRAGDAADANFLAPPGTPATLGSSDVQSLLDRFQGLIDPQRYLDLTAGLCEAANFEAPVSVQAFRDGVDIMPSHVGAGLVFDRPDETQALLDGLQSHGYALVAGPSGAGKSGLAWLAAHQSRHVIRWYRVRRLQPADVASLIRMIVMLDASPNRPVGFVVDDVGRQDTAGWDALVRDVGAHAGVCAIGTVRQEDLTLLSTAARTPTVRPALDEALAERIWQALKASGEVAFTHWREPFELSQGLLLEFMHLVVEGQRLQETLAEQVRRRLMEDRGDELLILRPVAFAAAQGCAVDPAKLRASLDLDEVRFAKALKRLIDEHAVRERPDGALTGLHEIRSAYLDEAVRETLGCSRQVSLHAAIVALAGTSFSILPPKVLRQWPEDEDPLLDSLAVRLRQGDVETWWSIFHGLGLATADRIAARWLEASRAANIPDRNTGTAFILATGGFDLTGMPNFTRCLDAKASFEQGKDSDFRALLQRRLEEDVTPPEMDLEGFHRFVAALLPLPGSDQEPAFNCHPQGDLTQAELEPLLAALRTLRELGLETAEEGVAAAGGAEALLNRIFHETPWATCPVIGQEGGLTTITGHIRFVHPEVQDDVHASVIQLCERMSAAVPGADLIVSQALFPDGSLAGYGDFAIADKRIPRANLVAPARVAWNRALLRALSRHVAPARQTGRANALAGAISELAKQLGEAADAYCRGKTPSAQWRLRLQVSDWLNEMIDPPVVSMMVGDPLDLGESVTGDDLHAFVKGLQRLADELTDGVSAEPLLMAARTATLAHEAATWRDPVLWRMTSQPPVSVLAEIETALWDIRAVLGEVAADPHRRRLMGARFSATSRRHSALRRAADESRERASRRAEAQVDVIGKTFAAHQLDVEVVFRPRAKDDGWLWPNVDFAVLLPVEDLIQFLSTEAAFTAAASDVPGTPSLSYAPVLNGWVVPLCLGFVGGKTMPSLTFAKEWAGATPRPILNDEDHALFGQGLDAVATIATAIVDRARDLNESETAFIDKLCARYVAVLERLVERLQARPDLDLAESAQFLASVGERVSSEARDGQPDTPFAKEMIKMIRGELNETNTQILGFNLVMLQRGAFLRAPEPAYAESPPVQTT